MVSNGREILRNDFMMNGRGSLELRYGKKKGGGRGVGSMSNLGFGREVGGKRGGRRKVGGS